MGQTLHSGTSVPRENPDQSLQRGVRPHRVGFGHDDYHLCHRGDHLIYVDILPSEPPGGDGHYPRRIEEIPLEPQRRGYQVEHPY